jgi:hypothetical protein
MYAKSNRIFLSPSAAPPVQLRMKVDVARAGEVASPTRSKKRMKSVLSGIYAIFKTVKKLGKHKSKNETKYESGRTMLSLRLEGVD